MYAPGDPPKAQGPGPKADDDFLSSLNSEQREAVLHTDGPLLILAGAGSGKTRVIAYRIAYLIGNGLARPFEVLAVTFTNKAAEEMRERVGKLIGADARDVWISTFHSLCARLLRREAPAIGLSRDFVIYDSSDQQAAVKQVMRELRVDDKIIQPRQVLGRISQAKNRMEAPDKVGNGTYRDEQIAKIYDGYIKALERASALDFDDLLLKTVELFEHEGVRAKYQRQFQYVMVDEYQDTNRPQYLLIKHLVGARHNLAVVGDPDQSIYRWRGADLRNILDFEHDFPEAATVRLERNYRSTQNILDAASAVIANNTDRKEKRLWTEQGRGDLITYFRGEDELEEASFIARELRTEMTARRDSTVAILYRLNSQSRALEDQLMRDGTPYRIIGGVRFYERKEVKDALSYLKLVINPHDDVSFRRVVNVPTRGIGKAVMDALERDDDGGPAGSAPPMMAAGLFEVAASRSLWAKASHLIASRTLPGRSHNALKQFVELIDALIAIARQEPVSLLIGKMLDQSGYLKVLREENSEEAESRIQNLAEFVSSAREYEEREPDASIGGFVDRLSLLSEADESQGASTARVWLMTMHAAKGLEFPVVALAGMEEGLFPHSRAGQDRGSDRGGASPLLRGHDARAVAAAAHQRGAAARVRRVPVDRALTLPRRDPEGARAGDAVVHAIALVRHIDVRRPRRLRVQAQSVRQANAGARRDASADLQVRGGRSVERRVSPEARTEGAPRAVRRRHRARGGGQGRRHEAHRPFRDGGHQEADREVRAPAARLDVFRVVVVDGDVVFRLVERFLDGTLGLEWSDDP